MSVPELFINGTALTSVAGFYVESWDGLLTKGGYRGDNIPIPGMTGVIGTLKVRAEFTFDIPIVLLGDTKAEQIATLDGIEALCPTNLNDLVRRLPSDDMVGYEDSSCEGDYLSGLTVETIGPLSGRASLSFVNLLGEWEPGS